MKKAHSQTSWEGVSHWYDGLVGTQGHYYHQNLIFPKLLPHLHTSKKILDLGCGQGIAARLISPEVEYWGVDISPSLIAAAKKMNRASKHHFMVGDATKKLVLPSDFDAVLLILCLQDIKDAHRVLLNASRHLKPGGQLCLVLNHPCFRIPRQSMWEVDEEAHIQYRRLNRYLSALSIPILTSPSKGNASPKVNYFHRSLTDYSRLLSKTGFFIALLEEWVSEKKSEGSRARMEDLARSEFPLFLFIDAYKQ